ncbi:MAG: FAD-dependent oxidoreductase [Pseudomonadota bacterium]
MKLAIIGTGISGLSAAHYLPQSHEIDLYEKSDRIGGHTATVELEHEGRAYAIDTGFIVYNDWTYPNFIEMLDQLGVENQPTEMSFSVRCDYNGLEYGGNNLNTLFAQRKNLLSPAFHRMLRDILRFNREAIADLERGHCSAEMRLGEYLAEKGYGQEFVQHYLLPMGCAIWSASTRRMIDFPLYFFVRFFKNHGLLSVNNRPQWRVVKGGSKSYLEPLTRKFRQSIHTGCGIKAVRRQAGSVELVLDNGELRQYDQVIFACHSDQALALLTDATQAERESLMAIPYQANEVVLHHDETVLPQSRRAWSSWNYRLQNQMQERAVLTYNMNILQGIKSDTTFCVTLNATETIAEDKILGRYEYSHPVFSLESVAAAKQIKEINGLNRTWFCGAYLGNGFHEDGVLSARQVAEALCALRENHREGSVEKQVLAHA